MFKDIDEQLEMADEEMYCLTRGHFGARPVCNSYYKDEGEHNWDDDEIEEYYAKQDKANYRSDTYQWNEVPLGE